MKHNIHCHCHKNPTLAPILSQLDPVRNSYFVLSFHLRLGLPTVPFTLDFSTKLTVYFTGGRMLLLGWSLQQAEAGGACDVCKTEQIWIRDLMGEPTCKKESTWKTRCRDDSKIDAGERRWESGKTLLPSRQQPLRCGFEYVQGP